MVRIEAGEQEAFDNFNEWLLESEAQKAFEEYVGRMQREYGILAEKKKIKRIKPDNRERVVGVSGVEYWKPKVKTQVYPEAKGNPILSNREVRGSILNKVFPDDEVFFLLFNKDLEKYGITNGEVYIKGQIIKKLINYRRVNSSNVLQTLRDKLHNIVYVKGSENHQDGGAVLDCIIFDDNDTSPRRYKKIVISLEGNHRNCITTYYEYRTENAVNALEKEMRDAGVKFHQ